MYLTTNQHDRLRTIVMNFEIPFRTYIAKVLLDEYAEVDKFVKGAVEKQITGDLSQTFKSQIGKIKSQSKYVYNLLSSVLSSMDRKVINEDINVPDVATIVGLLLLFEDLFLDFINMFEEKENFMAQIEKFHYVRNKLSHPGCKTLDEQDLVMVLNFVSNACIFIGIEYEDCFWDKTEDELYKEIRALESIETGQFDFVNNFDELPVLDNKIVCRENEVDQIKKFIYGIKGALRKKVSLSIYGYGGVGKTALVIEAIKSLIQDVMDETTLNKYIPDFILFLTAKEEALEISHTSGKIQRRNCKCNFSSFDELQAIIFEKLAVSDFRNYDKQGIIIIDNLETIEKNERIKIKEFIDYMSPAQIQYIITSRNEEDCEERIKLDGFEANNGKKFIKQYIEENELGLELGETEQETLLEMSKGNTLVLVLSLRRLSKKLTTLDGIVVDLSKIASVQSVVDELNNLPANGYEIICEFMFKNTFVELEEKLVDDRKIFVRLLQVFAVFPRESIDIYTICMLSDISYAQIEPYLNLLCRFLILERKEDTYSINGFAEKYIVQKFLPDQEVYERVSGEIIKSIKEIENDLNNLNKDLEKNKKVKEIIDDWFVTYEGDKIAVAKAYHLYQDVQQDCQRTSTFFVENAYNTIKEKIVTIEKMTMHPYVKYQKARMLALIYSTSVLEKDIRKEVDRAFIDCIFVIKNNTLYKKIKTTKNYASVLWIYGNFLFSNGDIQEATKYLEEGYNCFYSLGNHNKEYYQCCSGLARAYLEQFKKTGNKAYFQKAKKLSDSLYEERHNYMSDTKLKNHTTLLRREILSI